MDYQNIREWLTDPRERCIIVENGKPVVVLMGIEAYRELKGGTPAEAPLRRGDTVDPAEIVNAKLEEERIRARELSARMAMEPARAEIPAEPAQVRLEDLPI